MQNTAAGKPHAGPPCCQRGLSGLRSIFATESFSRRSKRGQARRAFGLGLKHPFNPCANLSRKQLMHQELQTKPTRSPFLTCRQGVLEALPPTPNTTATALGATQASRFHPLSRKASKLPKIPPARSTGDAAWTTHHETPNS